MCLLQALNIDVRYKNTIVFSNINFKIFENDYLCVVGSNGTGKSSLLKAILGLVTLHSGKIVYNIDKEEMSYLSQINNIQPKMPATVNEVVLTGTQKNGFRIPFYTKEDKSIAEEKMDLLDIRLLKNKRIGELSGGQTQRVLLARALCKEPKLLILDEPFASLDEEIAESFYKILESLNKDTSILMVSHDMNQVKKYSKNILCLDKKKMFFGEKDVFFSKVGCDK